MKTAFPTFNGYAPKEGVKALPIDFDFSAVASVTMDLLQENTQGVIQFVQSVWVDNTNNPNPLVIEFAITGQRITIPATAHGMWPVIAVDQVQFTISSVIGPNATGQIILMNVPMAYTQGGPVTVNVPAINVAAIATGAYDDYSATVAVGGTSQIAIPANPARLGWFIQNPVAEIEPLYINFTSAAAPGGGSVELLPGQIFPANGAPYVTLEAITVTAATTGHPFTAKEFV